MKEISMTVSLSAERYAILEGLTKRTNMDMQSKCLPEVTEEERLEMLLRWALDFYGV